MSEPEGMSPRDHISDTLDHLVKIGWVSEWGFTDARYVVHFTELGAERARWLRTIETETKNLNDKQWTILRLITAQHEPPNQSRFNRP